MPVTTSFRAEHFASPKQICDLLVKKEGRHRQPTISDWVFLFRKKDNIFIFQIYMNWVVLIILSIIPLVLFCLFKIFLTCLVMCSVGFYSVPTLPELHVLVNFRERSSQLPFIIKAGWLTAGNILNIGKT